MNKRGISPIVATVILVSIALILAVIIFLWARSFVGERALKEGQPVEYSCEGVNFEAEPKYTVGTGLSIDVVNRGNVPLYGLEIRKKDVGEISGVGIFESKTILNGETETLHKEDYDQGTGTLVLVPMILGETNTGKKVHTCDERYGLTKEI